MENQKKSNGVLVGILIGILITLLVAVCLYVTGIISFKTKQTNNNANNQSNSSNTENTNITDDTASNENKTNSSWTNYLLSQHLLEAKLTRERSKDLGDSEDFNKTITINKDDVKELLSKLEANKLSKTWSGGMGGPVRDQLTISYEHNDQKYEFVIIYGCIIVDKLDDEFKNILENNKFDEQDKEYENIQGAFYVYKLSDYTETIFDKYFE